MAAARAEGPYQGFFPDFDQFGTPHAQYLTLQADPHLTMERVFSPTPRFIITDNGPNGTYILELQTVDIAHGGTGAVTQPLAAHGILNFPSSAAGDIWYRDTASTVARLAKGADGTYLTLSSGLPVWASPPTGAAAGATYIQASLDGTNTSERAWADGSGISHTDGGANGNWTVAVDSTVVRTTGAQSIAGVKTFSNNVTLTNGTSLVMKGASFDDTISITSPAAARTLTIPDPGADASFIMSQGAQTKAGVLTLSASPVLSTNTVTGSGANTVTFFTSSDTVVGRATTDTLSNKTHTAPIFGSASTLTLKQSTADYTVDWANPGGARAYHVTDIGAAGDFLMKTAGGAYTSGGVLYGDGNKAAFCGATGSAGIPLVSGTSGTGPPTFTALTVPGGGTGLTSCTTGDLFYGSGSNTIGKLAKGTANQCLMMDGTGTNVTWGAGGALVLGDCSPLFTTSESSLTGTFSLSNAAAKTVLSNNNTSSGAPAYNNLDPSMLYQSIFSGGRLTLESGVPVSSTDQTAKTTFYFTPAGPDGNVISIYDGTRFIPCTFTEISTSVPASTSTMYSVWATQSGGTVSITTNAWTNDTTPGTNGATTLLKGVLVSSSDNTKRYLGVIRTTTSSGQCEDSKKRRFVGNCNNRVLRELEAHDTTDTWTYATGTWRSANSSTTVGTARTEVAIPVADSLVTATYEVPLTTGLGYIGIAMNSTSTPAAATYANVNTGVANPISITGRFMPAPGYSYFQNLEKGHASTPIFSGDEGVEQYAHQTGFFLNDANNIIDFSTRRMLRNSAADAPERRAA